jgi:hypothetical protein
VAAKLGRRLREPKLVDLLAESELDKKTDFADKKKLQELMKPSKRPSSTWKPNSSSTKSTACTNSC